MADDRNPKEIWGALIALGYDPRVVWDVNLPESWSTLALPCLSATLESCIEDREYRSWDAATILGDDRHGMAINRAFDK